MPLVVEHNSQTNNSPTFNNTESAAGASLEGGEATFVQQLNYESPSTSSSLDQAARVAEVLADSQFSELFSRYKSACSNAPTRAEDLNNDIRETKVQIIIRVITNSNKINFSNCVKEEDLNIKEDHRFYNDKTNPIHTECPKVWNAVKDINPENGKFSEDEKGHISL